MVYIEEPDLTTAYTESLKLAVDEIPLFGLQTRVSKPLLKIDEEDDQELRMEGLNIEPNVHRSLERFTFEDGKTIREWIQDRVDELFSGEYYERLTRDNWLNKSFQALRKLKTGEWNTWSTNRIVCQLYDKEDVRKNRQPIPPCLLMVDFKKHGDQLNLLASWRAQYFDTKAYGNMISLAMLLRRACIKSELQPGFVSNIAHKVIFKEGRETGCEIIDQIKL